MELVAATLADVNEIVSLRNEAARRLEESYGRGYWCSSATEANVKFIMREGLVYVIRLEGNIVGTFATPRKKPWAIDKPLFPKRRKPLYLTTMAIHPGYQGKGLGRQSLLLLANAVQEKHDAIWLDAYDCEAVPGEFYLKCGFIEVGRGDFRGVALRYFELPLAEPPG